MTPVLLVTLALLEQLAIQDPRDQLVIQEPRASLVPLDQLALQAQMV